MSKDALQDVAEKVWIEVGPIGASNVDDQLDHFLADEAWHRSVMLEQKFVQFGSNFTFFVSGHANPPFADNLKKSKIELTQLCFVMVELATVLNPGNCFGTLHLHTEMHSILFSSGNCNLFVKKSI